MNPPDDWQLVDEYASTGSHAAFETLVKRHAGWLYATARRRVGSADLADDVTQATFIVLARKARSIRRRKSLAAWLYRVANYAAMDALRRQGTQKRHERLAAKAEATMPAEEQNEAVGRCLDAALDSLSGRDREAVILRYFNDQTLEQIGKSQRVAASTVQRRLERSLAQIGYQLKRNGIATVPAGVVAALAATGVCTAPSSATAGLTAMASAAGALPANTAGSIGLAKGAMRTMNMIKLKFAAVAAITLGVVGAGGVAITHAVAQSDTVATAPPSAISSPAASAIADAGPASGTDFTGHFTTDWQQISVDVTNVNPANSINRGQENSQTMSIRAAITILDPSHILGFDRFNSAKITRMLDDGGHNLSSLSMNNDAANMRWYQPLQYNQQFDQNTQKLNDVLQPQQFNLTIKAQQNLPARLALVEGDVNVLTFDHTQTVDVPYVADGAATMVLPGVRLHFAVAAHDANSYHYQLVNDGGSDGRSFDGQLREGMTLPDRMIAEKYLVDSAGDAINENHHVMGSFEGNGAENGTGGMSGSDKIAAMRFEIAVGLKEQEVPFTLKNIKVPHLAAGSNALPSVAAPLLPLEQTEQELAQRLQEQRDRAPGDGWTDAKDQHVRELWKQFAADSLAGTDMKVAAGEVMGVRPDVTSYEQYLGTYRVTPPRVTASRAHAPAATSVSGDQSVVVNLRKDERGRLTLMVSEGEDVPLAGRDGALFGAVDPLFVPSDPLDPKSMPRLAGLWIVQSAGRTTLLMDIGRQMEPMVMERSR